MTATDPQTLIAEALEEHHAVGFGLCNCGWRIVTPLGKLWRPDHSAHQAAVIAALPGIAVVEGPKLAAIRALHVRDQDGGWTCHDIGCDLCQDGGNHVGPICGYCTELDPNDPEYTSVAVWPCQTVQIIDGVQAPGVRIAAGGES